MYIAVSSIIGRIALLRLREFFRKKTEEFGYIVDQLMESRTSCYVRCVCNQTKFRLWCRVWQSHCLSENLAAVVECFGCMFGALQKRFVVLTVPWCRCQKRNLGFGCVWHELSIKVYRCDEAFQLSYILWLGNTQNSFNPRGKRWDSIFRNHMAKEFYLWLSEDAFSQIYCQVVFSKPLEDFTQVLAVFVSVGWRDAVVIHVWEREFYTS